MSLQMAAEPSPGHDQAKATERAPRAKGQSAGDPLAGLPAEVAEVAQVLAEIELRRLGRRSERESDDERADRDAGAHAGGRRR
jgi:hypothetical protein